MLTKDQILKADDLATETVPVPEWGGEVLVRTMTGEERDRWESSITSKRGDDIKVNMVNLRARLCAETIVGDDGELLFTKEDIDVLGKKSAKALDRIFGVAQSLNGLGKNDLKELAKNSEAARKEDSTSS